MACDRAAAAQQAAMRAANLRANSLSEPSTAVGSGMPQCALVGRATGERGEGCDGFGQQHQQQAELRASGRASKSVL